MISFDSAKYNNRFSILPISLNLLLDNINPTITDSEYTYRMQAVFKAKPDPQTYMADIQVIIVNHGDQENRSQFIEVWDDPKDADEEEVNKLLLIVDTQSYYLNWN